MNKKTITEGEAKMGNYYLAVDIGASSGRLIIGSLENSGKIRKLNTEIIYRFENGIKDVDGSWCWDYEYLLDEIVKGLKKCKELGKIPVSMGVDTWGVDFVLLDKDGNPVGKTVSYRDDRTQGMDEEVYKIIPEDKLYERTGIQKAMYNTIYQLMAIKLREPELLERAERLILTPDYIQYLLTGEKAVEYTHASSSQLLNPHTGQWDLELIDMLGFPRKLFGHVDRPGKKLGSLRKEIEAEIGFSCEVVMPAEHDTGSAVLAVPAKEKDFLYISSGTWSLLGTELDSPRTDEMSHRYNFTNEGGYGGKIRFLKNIMGLWMIQSVRNELGREQSFAELCDMASQSEIASIVDCTDERFLAPKSMIEEIKRACEETNQQVPQTVGELAKVVYASLADCYAKNIKALSEITGKSYKSLHVVGGGSNADYLNHLTEKATGLKVSAGPSEATAFGNILAQMIAAGEVADVLEARTIVGNTI